MESAIYGKNQQKLFGIEKINREYSPKKPLFNSLLALHILMTSEIIRTVFYSLLVFGV
jgi:hypothetical protein